MLSGSLVSVLEIHRKVKSCFDLKFFAPHSYSSPVVICFVPEVIEKAFNYRQRSNQRF